MHIHFVCRGNTYRSRLAEAYCNSLRRNGIRATSSGTHATVNKNGPITWIAAFLLTKYDMTEDLSALAWTQSTPELFESADIIVFMTPEDMRNALMLFDFNIKKCVAFDIKDITTYDMETTDGILAVINKGEHTFEEIKKEVGRLVDTF